MDLSQLDALCSDLTVAAKTLKGLCDSKSSSLNGHDDITANGCIFPVIASQSGHEILEAQRDLCGIATRLQMLLAGPSCFIRRMAVQNQLLACLKWLGEFQVIACVPLDGSISIEELADLADVPEPILSRVVRMTATAGFLHEPQLGQVAHTALSAAFSTNLSYFDAAMFLANKAAPSALHMASTTQKFDGIPQQRSSGKDTRSAYMMALDSPCSFASDCAEGSQLSRQWSAYCQNVSSQEESLSALLGMLNWQSLGEASIVHICDRYTESSMAITQISQALRIIIQIYDYSFPGEHHAPLSDVEAGKLSTDRIEVQKRKPTTPQKVQNAAVYILQPSSLSLKTGGLGLHELLTVELQAHFEVLRSNPSALLILAPTLLPEPGSVTVNLEVQARLRDLTNLQLNNESTLEVTELFKLTESVSDQHGRLIVANRLRSPDGATIALAVKYQSSEDSYPMRA